MQKLLMPFNKCMMLCGYKNPEYTKYWGYKHYGVDISTIQGNASNDHRVLASGDGTVIDCGFDNSGGNIILIRYNDVYNHKTGKVQSLIARYMHLASINVKAGQNVSALEAIGIEGKSQTKGYHLHIEFETDINYPYHSPQVSGRDDKLTRKQGNILLHGPEDATINPSHIFYIGEGQTIVEPTYAPNWLNSEDLIIPKLDNNIYEEYKKALSELAKEKNKTASLKNDILNILKNY